MVTIHYTQHQITTSWKAIEYQNLSVVNLSFHPAHSFYHNTLPMHLKVGTSGAIPQTGQDSANLPTCFLVMWSEIWMFIFRQFGILSLHLYVLWIVKQCSSVKVTFLVIT